MRIQNLRVYSDSQLVVNQVIGTYKACDPTMVSYLAKAKQIIVDILTFHIKQIPRANNVAINTLFRSTVGDSLLPIRGIVIKILAHRSIHKD